MPFISALALLLCCWVLCVHGETIDGLFSRCDTDQNTFVDITELTTCIPPRKGGAINTKAIIQVLDANEDQKLTLAEFNRIIEKQASFEKSVGRDKGNNGGDGDDDGGDGYEDSGSEYVTVKRKDGRMEQVAKSAFKRNMEEATKGMYMVGDRAFKDESHSGNISEIRRKSPAVSNLIRIGNYAHKLLLEAGAFNSPALSSSRTSSKEETVSTSTSTSTSTGVDIDGNSIDSHPHDDPQTDGAHSIDSHPHDDPPTDGAHSIDSHPHDDPPTDGAHGHGWMLSEMESLPAGGTVVPNAAKQLQEHPEEFGVHFSGNFTVWLLLTSRNNVTHESRYFEVCMHYDKATYLRPYLGMLNAWSILPTQSNSNNRNKSQSKITTEGNSNEARHMGSERQQGKMNPASATGRGGGGGGGVSANTSPAGSYSPDGIQSLIAPPWKRVAEIPLPPPRLRGSNSLLRKLYDITTDESFRFYILSGTVGGVVLLFSLAWMEF